MSVPGDPLPSEDRGDRNGSGPSSDRVLSLADERALVERAKVDTDAFAELYRYYLPRIHAFAWRRTGNRQAAEDVCSATFEAALRNIGSYKWHRAGLAPWLFRIAANQTVTHHRREGRQNSPRGQAAMARLHQDHETDELEAVLDLATQGWGERDVLRAALDRINPRYQRAIALRFLADLEADAAAQALGVSKPTFAVVLSRGLKALRKELEGKELEAEEVTTDE